MASPHSPVCALCSLSLEPVNLIQFAFISLSVSSCDHQADHLIKEYCIHLICFVLFPVMYQTKDAQDNSHTLVLWESGTLLKSRFWIYNLSIARDFDNSTDWGDAEVCASWRFRLRRFTDLNRIHFLNGHVECECVTGDGSASCFFIHPAKGSIHNGEHTRSDVVSKKRRSPNNWVYPVKYLPFEV